MLGLNDLPARLRAYIVTIAVIGATLTIGRALRADGPFWESESQFGIATLLTLLVVFAERYTFRLSYQTTINVATAAQVAMIITLPLGLPALVVWVALVVGHLFRRADRAELLFNPGQGALYVAAGALAFHAVLDTLPRMSFLGADLAIVVATLVASATLHLANTLLVAIAVGLQMGVNPLRVWTRNIGDDVLPHATLTAIGGIIAIVASSQPLALPLLVTPVFLVRHAVRQTVRLRTDTVDALASMVEIVELRDPYTAGHSRRVAATARALALRLGMTAEEADVLESAGRVHDVGKVAVDPRVLLKDGKLDDAEWDEMKRHPVHGAEVIARFNAFERGYLLVRHHHESWDGHGYPDGLTGDAIPLGARILAVADTWDALTSDRPYRRGMAPAVAIQIMREGAGVQWDARVVTALLEHLGYTAQIDPIPEPTVTVAA